MIGVLVSTPAQHGNCVECDQTDDRGETDRVLVFRLGTFTLRLCDKHADDLTRALMRAMAA